MATRILVDEKEIQTFCERHGIRRLALFGSALRDDFGPESDVDVLVEFEAGRRVGFIRLAALEAELSGLLGRRADLRTLAELSPYFREEVVQRAEVLYARS